MVAGHGDKQCPCSPCLTSLLASDEGMVVYNRSGGVGVDDIIDVRGLGVPFVEAVTVRSDGVYAQLRSPRRPDLVRLAHRLAANRARQSPVPDAPVPDAPVSGAPGAEDAEKGGEDSVFRTDVQVLMIAAESKDGADSSAAVQSRTRRPYNRSEWSLVTTSE